MLPQNRVTFVTKRSNCLDVSCYSNHWESLLGWQVGRGSKVAQRVSIPEWVKRQPVYTIACLRGLLETDGSMYVDRGYPMVMFVNAGKALATDVSQTMASLGFAPRTYVITRDRGQPVFHVRLSRQVAEFVALIRPRKA